MDLEATGGSRIDLEAESGDRVLTIPNALSALRLLLVPVFLYLLLSAQSSRLGELLDPLVDRIYMLVVPVALAIAHVVPWWIVLTLIGRDLVLAATLPPLRGRGLTALPVTYIGKAATFALMSGFPLVLLGQWPDTWSRVVLACGWAFLAWGMVMYLWSAALYLIQVTMVLRQMPPVTRSAA
ncbi:CDP-alcohol phosphatidyltransferase family protein [Mycolicibacterium sp. CBMA 361]|uniref:CDP-alcohol phosphatidyltransferase family protein n=1 Tax=Mycolicibacterium sp. CBMA 361 TaxID=2606610 RepID=UPI0012DBD1E9|nr:CDP-alcohol phosphatidyltransferase family protein [Mycolicibacterium sp. CBMA 361]MUM35668.1 CDP-alcohol phosphatidyltransferase family protein [Mycolicibacterium sp. CBMA 361]